MSESEMQRQLELQMIGKSAAAHEQTPACGLVVRHAMRSCQIAANDLIPVAAVDADHQQALCWIIAAYSAINCQHHMM
jgi:hypothetical protein